MWKIAGFAICLTVLLIGCGPEPPHERLQHRTEVLTAHPWVYDMQETSDRTNFDSLTTQERNMVLSVLNNLQGAVFAFRPDSSFSIIFGPGDSIIGHWEFNQDASEIMIQPTPVKVQFQPIEEFEANKIVLGIDKTRGFIFPRVLVPPSEAASE